MTAWAPSLSASNQRLIFSASSPEMLTETLSPKVTCTNSGGASAPISVSPSGVSSWPCITCWARGPSVPMSPKVMMDGSPPSTEA